MAKKNKTLYQEALKEAENSSGSTGETTGETTNRPKSREKNVTGIGNVITKGRKAPSTMPGWDDYTKKTGTVQQTLTDDIKPNSRTAKNQPGLKVNNESVKRKKKPGSGRKF